MYILYQRILSSEGHELNEGTVLKPNSSQCHFVWRLEFRPWYSDRAFVHIIIRIMTGNIFPYGEDTQLYILYMITSKAKNTISYFLFTELITYFNPRYQRQ